jgi:RNA polymerase sigma-70 factor (ECF subfamily)
VPEVEPPESTRLGEVVWLEPYPDALLAGAIDVPLGPEARYEQTESISLAFVTALQVLPPRQLAVLILRDVLGFHASEVAYMLDSTVESVTSALKRARASLQRRRPPTADREPPPASDSPSEDAIVAKFVGAWESADLDALVALLTDYVFVSMPPMPSNTRAETSRLASAPASSAQVGGSSLFRREPTVSLRSEPTCAPLPASATGSASTSSASAAIGSAQ